MSSFPKRMYDSPSLSGEIFNLIRTEVRLMSLTGNQKKDLQLGMSHGKAQHKLKKSILFGFLVKTNENFCYRCNKKIENIEELSIEHKIAWLDSENPVDLFFDLNNIAFSHLSCNCAVNNRDMSYAQTEQFKNKLSVINRGEKGPKAKLTWIKVREIREKLKFVFGIRQLGKEYQVAHQQIMKIRDNITWKI